VHCTGPYCTILYQTTPHCSVLHSLYCSASYHVLHTGCGIVEFSSPLDAQRAINQLNDTPLLGRMIFVREDREEGDSRGFDRGNGMDRGNSHRHVQMPSNNQVHVSVLLNCISLDFALFSSLRYLSSALLVSIQHTHTNSITHKHLIKIFLNDCTIFRHRSLPSHPSIPPYSSTHSQTP
jgi:RNA recognition motif-containing protein